MGKRSSSSLELGSSVHVIHDSEVPYAIAMLIIITMYLNVNTFEGEE